MKMLSGLDGAEGDDILNQEGGENMVSGLLKMLGEN